MLVGRSDGSGLSNTRDRLHKAEGQFQRFKNSLNSQVSLQPAQLPKPVTPNHLYQ